MGCWPVIKADQAVVATRPGKVRDIYHYEIMVALVIHAQVAPVVPGGLAGPAAERPGKAAGIRKSQQEAHLGDADPGLLHIGQGQ